MLLSTQQWIRSAPGSSLAAGDSILPLLEGNIIETAKLPLVNAPTAIVRVVNQTTKR
jgi:hypothetical protein